MSKRKGAWRFSAVWTFPGHMVAATSTDPIVVQNDAGGVNSNVRAAHTVDGDVERLTPVYVRNKLQIKDKGARLSSSLVPRIPRGRSMLTSNCGGQY